MILCVRLLALFFGFIADAPVAQLRPSNSHFRSNKSTMVKLTRLTVETGLVTTVAAVLELILGLAFQTTYYHIAL